MVVGIGVLLSVSSLHRPTYVLGGDVVTGHPEVLMPLGGTTDDEHRRVARTPLACLRERGPGVRAGIPSGTGIGGRLPLQDACPYDGGVSTDPRARSRWRQG
jgi:hypothetical protein